MSANREPHPLLEHPLLKSEKSAKGNFLSIILLFGHQMFLPLLWISVSLSFVKFFSSCTLSHCFCTPTHVPEIIFINYAASCRKQERTLAVVKSKNKTLYFATVY